MILRVVSLAIGAVFAYGLAQSKPWAHSAWTPQSWERFILAMCATAVAVLGLHRLWFYGIVLVLGCSVGVLPILGLGFVLLAGLNLGWVLFHNEDDRLNLLAGFAMYVWIFSLTASLPIHTIWLWGLLLAAPIAIGRRFVLPLPQPSIAVAMPLVANFLLVLKPEVSADGLSQHFAIAQWVKDHGRFHFDAANLIWSVQPMAGDWALTLANLFGGEYAARMLNFVWLLVLVSFVYRTLRRRLGHGPAAVLTGIFASTPLLQLTSTSMFIENFWSAMIVGALLAIEQGDVMLAAALAGASGASKLLGLTPVPVLGAYALWKRPKRLLAAFALFLAIAVVPYARAFWVTGNPVFHYANAVFKSPLMRSDQNFVDPRFPARLNWHTLYDVTFHTDLFVESEPGTAGYQWLWFLPLALVQTLLWWPAPLRSRFGIGSAGNPIRMPPIPGEIEQTVFRAATVRERASAMELAALATALFLVALVFSRQASLRYVECAMPLLAIAFAPAAAAILADRWMRHAASAIAIAILALNLFQMPASGGYHRDFSLIPFNTSEREQYLTRMAPIRQLIDKMNAIAPGAAVADFTGSEIAGLRGPVYTSTWHTPRFSERLLVARSVADFVHLLRDFRTEYVIAPKEGHWQFIRDSPLDVFIQTSTERISTSGDLQLVKLLSNTNPVEPPPAPPGTYDDSNARIIYTGRWFLDQSFPNAARGTVSYSSDANAAVRFAFEGTKLTYTFTKAFNRGKALVEIDGVSKGTINLYSVDAQWQSAVIFDHLGAGPHIIVIRYAGLAGSFIDVDLFVVE